MTQNRHEERRPYEDRVETKEAERIAIAAAKLACNDALNELFASFGVNRANIEAMESLRDDLRFIRSLRRRKDIWDDLAFLNTFRHGSIRAGSRFVWTLITIAAGGFALGVGASIREWIRLTVAKH